MLSTHCNCIHCNYKVLKLKMVIHYISNEHLNLLCVNNHILLNRLIMGKSLKPHLDDLYGLGMHDHMHVIIMHE